MTKKLSWLDKFAEDQAKKMEKTAALNKQAEQIIVDPDDVPGAVDGAEVTYQGESYKVLNASFKDDSGLGVVLEKVATEVTAAVEEIPAEGAEVPVEDVKVEETVEAPIAAPVAAPVAEKKVTDAPEYARTNPGAVYDIPVRDTVEVDKFNAEATETANQIAAEDAIDGTTPAGKVNRVLNRMQVAPVAETPVAEVAPVEDAKVEDVVPVEDVKVEEAPAEDVVEDAAAPVEDNKEVVEDDSKAKLANNRIFKKIIATLK